MAFQITFDSAKSDVVNAWENPLKDSDRITRDWIYGVDPETMDFVKEVFTAMPGEYSLYKTFVRVMKSKNFNELLRA